MWNLWKKKTKTVVPPSLKKLLTLGDEIERRFQHEYPAGLWDVGGHFREFDEAFGYWCTPENVATFGGDGMDGNHFSSLIVSGRVDGASPVIFTTPSYDSSPEGCSCVAAANFDDFLRLGLVVGFHCLSHLVDSPDETLSDIVEWASQEPTDPRDVRRRAILKFVADELELESRCPTAEEFHALQGRYKPLLKFPPR